MAVVIASTDSLGSDITTGVSTLNVTRAAGEGLFIGFAWIVEWESQPTITSVVWDESGDNQSFTLVDNVQFNNADRRMAVYYLANPVSAKSSTIKITWSKSCGSSGLSAIVRHVTGHDTASPLRGSLTTTGNVGGGSSLSADISSSSTDLVIDFLGAREAAVYLDPLSGQTSHYERDYYNGNQSASSSSKAGATTVNTGYTSFNTNAYGAALIQLSIKEATGGGTNASDPGGTGTSTGSGSGGDATGGSGGGTNASDPGGTGTSTGSGSGGNAVGGGSGTFTFDACENNTHSGALSGVAVNWAWHSGGNVGSGTTITNGSGTMTTSGMTISGLPAGVGYGVIRSADGTVVAYQEGTVS